jgi:uncharacterized protein (TIGR02147 family)
MSLYKHNDIRNYIKELLSKRPRGGRGELQLIAKALGVHSTLISQIMSGMRSLTEDQAHELCHYFELNEVESEYFLLLVQIEKANTAKYKNFLKNKLVVFRQEAEKISKSFTHEKELDDSQKSIYFSSWKYSAIRIYCSLDQAGQSLENIMAKFSLTRTKALHMIDFLCDSRLCEKKNDLIVVGQQRVYIDKGSIYFQKHHLNWRLKSVEKSENPTDDDKLYTVILGVTEKDYQKFKDEVTKLLSSFSKTLEQTENPDQLVCFNCDLFKV